MNFAVWEKSGLLETSLSLPQGSHKVGGPFHGSPFPQSISGDEARVHHDDIELLGPVAAGVLRRTNFAFGPTLGNSEHRPLPR